MQITLWGTRGSLATQNPHVTKYGGNTSCVTVRANNSRLLILDAGTGIRPLGLTLANTSERIDILLSHLHMDHIVGLGFFAPLYEAGREIHIHGPAKLRAGLTRYLSPPLFPVHLAELPCKLFLHTLAKKQFKLGPFSIASEPICHPGQTLGYRISTKDGSMAYLPDHEPILVNHGSFPADPTLISGYNLTADVDLLLHDSQYSLQDYREHVGWGHSALEHALQFAMLTKVKEFVTFHHNPSYDDQTIDALIAASVAAIKPTFKVWPGCEGSQFNLT